MFLTRRGTRVDFSPLHRGLGFLGGNTKDFGFDLTGSQYWSTCRWMGFCSSTARSVHRRRPMTAATACPCTTASTSAARAICAASAFRKVGPLDYKGNPVGGRTLARATAEYTYPIIARVRGAFFYDAGYVNQDAFDFGIHDLHERSDFRFDPNRTSSDPKVPRPNPTANDLKYVEFGGGLNMDIGLGVRLDLPIGPVRFDYGYPIESNDFNTRHSGKFNFNVGYQF